MHILQCRKLRLEEDRLLFKNSGSRPTAMTQFSQKAALRSVDNADSPKRLPPTWVYSLMCAGHLSGRDPEFLIKLTVGISGETRKVLTLRSDWLYSNPVSALQLSARLSWVGDFSQTSSPQL